MLYLEKTQGCDVMIKKPIKRKAVVNHEECVACGSCVKVCPMSTIQVYKGLFAQVDYNKCIGCGMCANECPASVIKVEVVSNEEKS